MTSKPLYEAADFDIVIETKSLGLHLETIKLCLDIVSIKQGSIHTQIYITAIPIYEGARICLGLLNKIFRSQLTTDHIRSFDPFPI